MRGWVALPPGKQIIYAQQQRLIATQMTSSTPPTSPDSAATEADRQACLLRLSQYSPDAPDAPVPFSHRLAEAEGWSRLYTLAVIEEYKRFAYLAVFAGHAVTPSEAIDAAWHLHLQYSKEYWTVFCGEVLGAPLHHAPGIGAPDEDDTYAQHYQQTIESYQRTFGMEPPPDVWPVPEPVQPDSAPEAASPARHPPNPVTPPRASTARSVMPSVWLVIGACLIAITTNVASDFDVLNYAGPRFLAFYLGVCLMACLLIRGLHRFAYPRRPWGAADGNVPRQLAPAEAALITGDATRMAQVATLTLLDASAIRVASSAKRKRDRNTYVVANETPTPERHVDAWTWLARQPQRRSPWPAFRDRFLDEAIDMTDRLRHEGWMWATGAMRGTTVAAWAIGLSVLWLGVIKVFVGLSRERPVMWLLVEMALFGIVYWCVTARLIGVGRAGPTAGASAALDVHRQRSQLAPRAGLSTSDLLWLAAFGGTSVLANTAWAGYRPMMGTPAGASSSGSGSDTSSNCSSSSSSSSCSSSSCGSSGCGGCSSS
ncbi:TIGR04222 domain-containing membrane protein [Ralstonia sp.]|uniref:TIGR04222 domain-containing membrane protein n=1 Tax=Ralstonia sp. TaxID=54061 RepID=UPI002BCA9199|nr:TIGR04222 domain-containing membrane protein [Ralstonia sp.]HWV04374.1 TIGR04222 domain-containing membrane protein [Ralstonia sp.]